MKDLNMLCRFMRAPYVGLDTEILFDCVGLTQWEGI